MSRKVPKVSVIMPAYNVERYVGRAIESMLNQTLDNIEVIKDKEPMEGFFTNKTRYKDFNVVDQWNEIKFAL